MGHTAPYNELETSSPETGGGSPAIATPEGGEQPDPSVPPQFDASGLFNIDGKFEEVGERYASENVSADFINRYFKGKTPTDIAESLKANQAAARAKAVTYPNAESTDEDRAAWNKAANVPESVEQVMPEDFESFQNATGWTPEVAQPVIDAMIQAGTPGPAITAAIAAVQQAATAQGEAWQAAAQEESETAQQAVREAFGVEYDAKISQAQAAAERAGINAGLSADEVADLVKGVGEVRNPFITRAFAAISGSIQEAQYKGVQGGNLAGAYMGPREEAFDIMNNPTNPMYEKYRASDKAVHAHVDGLLAKATAR